MLAISHKKKIEKIELELIGTTVHNDKYRYADLHCAHCNEENKDRSIM